MKMHKKYLALVLSVLFTLGFAVSAFADPVVAAGTTAITLGGDLRFQGEYRENIADFNDNVSNAADVSKYDGRVRINLTAVVSKTVSGKITLESAGFQTSLTNNSGGWNWGYPSTDAGASGLYAEGNASKRGPLAISEAWIQYKTTIGSIPASLKMGHFAIKVSNGLFFNHTDDLILLALDPTPALHIELFNAKLNEGVDVYATRVCVNNTTGAITTTTGAACGTGTTQLATSGTATGTTSNGGQGISNDSDAYAITLAYKGTGFNLGGDVTLINDQDFSAQGLQLYNYGLRADTKIGQVGIFADAEIQSGTAKADAGGTDIKYKGYAYLVGVNTTLGGYKVDLSYGLGSGDDNASDTKINTFITAGGGTVGLPTAPFVFGGKTKGVGVTAPSTTGANSGSTSRGLSNLTYYKAGITGNVSKNIVGTANYYILNASKQLSSVTPYDSRDIGAELDVKLTYTIEKNLVYTVDAGYLFAGDFFKNLTAGLEPDNAWGVVHGLTLSF